MDKVAARSAIDGLTRLGEMAGNLRDSFAPFQTAFEEAADVIRVTGYCTKALDLLLYLQFECDVLLLSIQQPARPQAVAEALIKIISVRGRLPDAAPGDVHLTTELHDSLNNLETAWLARDYDSLDLVNAVVGLLRQIKVGSAFNLSKMERHLNLHGLIHAIAAIATVLRNAGAGLTDLEQLEVIVSALTALQGRLTALTYEYGLWQQVKVLAEDALADGRSSFVEDWRSLEDRLSHMYRYDPSPVTDTLLHLTRTTYRALQERRVQSGTRAQEPLVELRLLVTQRLFTVATDLDAFAGELLRVEGPVESILIALRQQR